MNLKITGLNFDVTEAIKNYVSDKLARINRHADNIISVTITLSVEKVNQKAEADAHLAGKDLHVEAIEQDMYAAIDVLMDKLDRAVLKHKEKSGDVRSTVKRSRIKFLYDKGRLNIQTDLLFTRCDWQSSYALFSPFHGATLNSSNMPGMPKAKHSQ